MEQKFEILEAIRTRRSIRVYHPDQPLPPEAVQIIMEAGLRAPSSKNRHTTQFILIEDKEKLVELSYMRSKGGSYLREVPFAVVLLGSPMECRYWIEDAALAAGYMQLQAWALGIGSCWIDVQGQVTANGQDSDEYVRNALGIPYQLEVACILTFGYVNGEASERPIESLKWEKIHIGQYQEPEVSEGEA